MHGRAGRCCLCGDATTRRCAWLPRGCCTASCPGPKPGASWPPVCADGTALALQYICRRLWRHRWARLQVPPFVWLCTMQSTPLQGRMGNALGWVGGRQSQGVGGRAVRDVLLRRRGVRVVLPGWLTWPWGHWPATVGLIACAFAAAAVIAATRWPGQRVD